MRKQEPLYEVDLSIRPPSCLPGGIDRSNLIDITTISDPWRKYLNARSGAIHDGSVYYELAMIAAQDKLPEL
jgi:hypothetical protein